VLGQLYDGQSSIENSSVLEAEFENLVQGEEFRSGFEDLAREYGTSLPSKQLAAVIVENFQLNFLLRVSLQSCTCNPWTFHRRKYNYRPHPRSPLWTAIL
jgi:hypothetical protein